MKKAVVLAGGDSSEREVSLRSGEAVMNGLIEAGYNCILWDYSKDKIQDLLDFSPDMAFIALHGNKGEDGAIQGFLEILNIPYTGSKVLASAIGMDKQFTKKFFAYENIPTPNFVLANSNDDTAKIVAETKEKLGLPVIVKPAKSGSSIGISFAQDEESMSAALKEAFAFDSKIVIEEYITGTELTVSILGPNHNPTVLPIIEIAHRSGEIWDYDAKYSSSESTHIIPARISDEIRQEVETIAKQIYRAAECSGYARIDFMLSEDNRPYAIEINTAPGMTETSLFPDAARATDISFSELVDQIIKNIED